MIPTILRDALPRQLAYAVSGVELARELQSLEPFDAVGMFFLFTSGVQLDYYDPIVSRSQIYPVLALDRGMPQLTGNAVEQLRRKTGRGAPEKLTGSGVARAQAQLLGQTLEELEASREHGGELDLCDVSVCVFPVKTRLRRRIARHVTETGIRPIRNWLVGALQRREPKRPLVILYDERLSTVTSKFADPWAEGAPRYYK